MSKYLKNAIVFNKQGYIIMHFGNQINLMFDSQLMEWHKFGRNAPKCARGHLNLKSLKLVLKKLVSYGTMLTHNF